MKSIISFLSFLSVALAATVPQLVPSFVSDLQSIAVDTSSVPEEKIFNGAKSDPIPIIVSLQWPTSSGWGHFCGGTLIAPNRILTAYHCFDPKVNKDTRFRAVLGTTINQQPAQQVEFGLEHIRRDKCDQCMHTSAVHGNGNLVPIPVLVPIPIFQEQKQLSRSRSHRNGYQFKVPGPVPAGTGMFLFLFPKIYTKGLLPDGGYVYQMRDNIVVQLPSSANVDNQTVSTVCLAGEVSADKYYAAGWGDYNCDKDGSSYLRYAEAHVLDNQACQKAWRDNSQSTYLTPYKQTCSFFKQADNSDTPVYSGDSGGPLVAVVDGKPVQVVIASFVAEKDNCIILSVPPMFSKVSAHQAFIKKHAPEAEFC